MEILLYLADKSLTARVHNKRISGVFKLKVKIARFLLTQTFRQHLSEQPDQIWKPLLEIRTDAAPEFDCRCCFPFSRWPDLLCGRAWEIPAVGCIHVKLS